MAAHMDQQTRRIALMTAHLADVSNGHSGVERKECAATHLSTFARPSASDTRFARPAEQGFPRDERVLETALIYGSGLLQEAEANPAAPRSLSKQTKRQMIDLSVPNTFQSIRGWSPQVHIITKTNGTVFVFVLPGVKAGDIRLRLSGNALALSGKRIQGIRYTEARQNNGLIAIERHERQAAAKPSRTPISRPVLSEGQFEASWILPSGDLQGMQATFNNERLRVFLPANKA